MNLMQLIKSVLDDAYTAISAPDEKAKDAQILEELANLSTEYKNLLVKGRAPIDYSDGAKRFAYIYKYTVAHADYIMQLIAGEKELRDLLAKDSIEVACLGGGPGSDLLGLLKYLIRNGASGISLKCYIFDKERAWGDSWSDVASSLKPPFQIFPVFQQLDVTVPETWASYQKYLKADLFTMSYFLSEVWKIKEQAEPFFQHCLSRMKPGSMVLFIDNNDSRFYEWFDKMAQDNNLISISSGNGSLCFSNDEEKTDLGAYLTKFDWPLRRSDAAWRIMKKV